MDDPLSLLAFAVWTLAAGMYPLGFMFGVCSACCDDECPDRCDRCSGVTHFDINWSGVCQDTFDLFTLESDIDVATKANVTPSGLAEVNISVDLLTGLNCESLGSPGTVDTLTIRILAGFFENLQNNDECGCAVCLYEQQLRMQVPGYSDSQHISCAFRPTFTYDKCESSSATATLTLTKQQLEDCLANNFSGGWVCEGLPDEVEVTLTYDLDYECECGACCRDGVCSENESQSYCENGDFIFAPDGNGVWQGVGTVCDPNPCSEPE